MYTSHVGKKFINNVISRRKPITVKRYFEGTYFDLFFDHSQYLQSPANTPLFQLIAQKKTGNATARKKGLAEIHSKIDAFVKDEQAQPEMSFAIGYPSADIVGTTSGQISSLQLPLDQEDMYASWIGSAFGIGMEGGLNILFDNEELMVLIEEGWGVYRRFVDQNKGIGNKIETWNAIWLCHRLSDEYDEKKPVANFHPVSTGKRGEAVLERPTWTKMMFAWAKKFPRAPLNGYVYSFGQMNKTVGFIQVLFPEVKTFTDTFRILYGKVEGLRNQKLEQIYEAERGFGFACENGAIGLRSLEPKGLRKFMPGRTDKNEMPREKQSLETQITYSIYITWIIAMLNNKELLELAEKASAALHQYVAGKTNVKTTRSNLVEKILNARSRQELIDGLASLVADDNAFGSAFNPLVNEVMLNIPNDNIRLFVTLLRFKFSVPNKQH